jgi:predicted oxidoreductase (fatty acid repression mutant protein)
MRKDIQSPEIEQLVKEKAEKTPGAAYFVQQKIDVLLQAEVHKIVSAAIEVMMAKLRERADDARKNPLLRDKNIVLNAVFLVDDDNVEVFIERVENISLDFPALNIKTTGPFTPYNFVK